MGRRPRYYPYKQIGELVNAPTSGITTILSKKRILEVCHNPSSGPKYQKLCVTVEYKLNEAENYEIYFRERFCYERGKERYILEISDRFVEYIKELIEKEGEKYGVRFYE